MSRNTEVGDGLVKSDVVPLLLKKGLSGQHGPLASQMASWCLGSLIYTDVLADTLIAQGVGPAVANHLRAIVKSDSSTPDDVSAAIYPIARLSRSIKIAKSLNRFGCVEPLAYCLNTGTNPEVLMWSARAVGCLMRPNSGDMAKVLLEAGTAKGLARLPKVIPPEAIHPLESFAFAIQRFSCAE